MRNNSIRRTVAWLMIFDGLSGLVALLLAAVVTLLSNDYTVGMIVRWIVLAILCSISFIVGRHIIITTGDT